MKKFLSFLLAISMVLSCIAVPVFAADDIKVTIDGVAQSYDVMPVLENDRTLVPMRGIFEALGAEISWEEATETVTGVKGDITVVLQIGNTTAKVNGADVILDVPAKLINDRTMVPVRFISESLGCKVDWEDATQTVIITSPKEKHMLDGKKVIFIGNSYVYYGNCVLPKGRTEYTWEDRKEDKGYFYQLCKENGADVTVTNWCFTGHTTYNTFDGPCDGNVECKGVVHEDHLEDRYFDYVIVSPHAAGGEQSGIEKNLKYIEDFFRPYNPDVKFVCLGNHAVYGITNKETKFPGISDYYVTLAEKGWIIADWGSVVRDIVEGGVAVPGATMEYNIRTFINTRDGYHENTLAGYLTALTAYCAITGEKAVGQPYEFCYDASLGSRYDLVDYKNYFYKKPEDTNFLDVFHSPADMKGLQELVDCLFM